MIDARLHGERERTLPRVYARPVELRRGQSLSQQDLVSRLNDLGYAQRAAADSARRVRGRAQRGRHHAARRRAARQGRPRRDSRLRRRSRGPAAPTRPPRGIQDLEIVGSGRTDAVQLDSPLLTALMTSGGREKRRSVPLADDPEAHAAGGPRDRGPELLLASRASIPFRLIAAALTNVFGDNPNLVGYSTITQQLARMFFLADEFNAELPAGERSYGRKLREMLMSLVLERRASKDEILELYLNDVYLGQRGSFAIHGVAEASRLFFGKDVANLSLSEAALIAGVIQSPASRSPFANPKRAIERRNMVLRAMADEEFISEDAARRARSASRCRSWRARSTTKRRTSSTWSSEQVATAFPGVTAQTGRGGRLHDARPQPAARGARRGAERPGQRRPAARAPAPRPAARRRR